jgi:hypothetical protein
MKISAFLIDAHCYEKLWKAQISGEIRKKAILTLVCKSSKIKKIAYESGDI